LAAVKSARLNAGILARLAAVFLCASAANVPHAVAQDLDARRADTARELETIRQQIVLGDKRRAELSDEIGRLEKDRASINKALIDAAARARTIQADIEASGQRLDDLNAQRAEIRASLSSRRAVLAEVLGSLLRMGAHPPPAILVKPQDALSAVRSAIALGAVVPEMRAETQVLASELAELERIGRDIDIERSSLSVALARQAEDEERMALILEEKKKLTSQARQELADQGRKAAELAARETDLSALVGKIENEIAAVREAALAATKAEEARAAREQELLKNARTLPPADFSDTGRIAPAMAFEKATGLLPRPVEGVEINAFGSVDALGKPSPGLSIATTANARVASPADGWVAYAGPFRSYGQLLILNAGNGYHVVLAGMERIDVQLGQFVLAGEPVAAMGSQRIASVEAIGVESSRPVLYVEFRKDGKSIDPSPWWADTSLKRVADDS
jgi:septal ring factor EnvC (AmiA/AmiB activator)